MNENLVDLLRDRFQEKTSENYLELMQKIKMFIDTRMSEAAGKNSEQSAQIYFSTMLSVRDTISAEIVEHAVNTQIKSIIYDACLDTE